MRCHIVFALAFLSICVTSRKIRGISLSYKRFYRERKSFLCIDGSKMIPFEQVNDDYCDCEDGSDEPGTAACGNGRFYCTNLGFRPHYIPSSRVNDGICDCCDASDEYNSHTRCQNSCRNLGQRERAEMEGQRKTLDEGLRLKEQLIEEGALVWREKQAQLRDLLRVSAELQVKLEENKRRRPDAPTVAEDSSRSLNWTATGIFLKLDCNKDGRVTAEEVRSEVVLVREEERGVSSDEAVALLGGAQQVSLAAFQQTLWDSLRTGDRVKIRGTRGAPGSPADEDPDIKATEGTDDGDAADLKNVALAAETVHMEIRYGFSPSDLREKLALDYGLEREFLILSSQCYQLKVYGYTYTLCPFNQVTQKSAAGTQVSLGKWGTWLGSPNNRYNLMKYENGQPCWQGPARNTVVTLTCGMETALRSVKEPSKCQYVMEFESPVACQPAPRQQDGHSEL